MNMAIMALHNLPIPVIPTPVRTGPMYRMSRMVIMRVRMMFSEHEIKKYGAMDQLLFSCAFW